MRKIFQLLQSHTVQYVLWTSIFNHTLPSHVTLISEQIFFLYLLIVYIPEEYTVSTHTGLVHCQLRRMHFPAVAVLPSSFFFTWGINIILFYYGWGICDHERITQLSFCQNTRTQKHLQVYQTMITPPQRGFHVIAHINLTLDVCAQTEKESGLGISWLPTFSSKWLIRGVMLSGLLDRQGRLAK